MATITDPKGIAGLLRSIDDYMGGVVTRGALQLAHVERNSVRAAYNYAEFLPERKKMMQAWADYLDSLKRSGKSGKVAWKEDPFTGQSAADLSLPSAHGY